MNALSNILYPQEEKVTIATTQQHFIDHLERSVDWNKVFGVVDSLYSDDGFTSNADNFTRATAVERALDKFFLEALRPQPFYRRIPVVFMMNK